MTKYQLSRATEINNQISKEKSEIEELKIVMSYGGTKNIIVNAIAAIKLALACGSLNYEIDLTPEELKVLVDYKAEKISKLEKELSEI